MGGGGTIKGDEVRSPLDGAGCRIVSPAPAGVGTPSAFFPQEIKNFFLSILECLQGWGLLLNPGILIETTGPKKGLKLRFIWCKVCLRRLPLSKVRKRFLRPAPEEVGTLPEKRRPD